MPTLDQMAINTALQRITLLDLNNQSFYRSVNLYYTLMTGQSILDGSNSGRSGGRYNSPNSEPTSYFSGSQTLAAFECEQSSSLMKLASARSNPRISCTIIIDGANVLDLTNNHVCSILGTKSQYLCF